MVNRVVYQGEVTIPALKRRFAIIVGHDLQQCDRRPMQVSRAECAQEIIWETVDKTCRRYETDLTCSFARHLVNDVPHFGRLARNRPCVFGKCSPVFGWNNQSAARIKERNTQFSLQTPDRCGKPLRSNEEPFRGLDVHSGFL